MYRFVAILMSFIFPRPPSLRFEFTYLETKPEKDDEPAWQKNLMFTKIFSSVIKAVTSIFSPPKPAPAPAAPTLPEAKELPSQQSKNTQPVPDDKAVEVAQKQNFLKQYGGRGRGGSILTAGKDKFKEDGTEAGSAGRYG